MEMDRFKREPRFPRWEVIILAFAFALLLYIMAMIDTKCLLWRKWDMWCY